MISHAAAIAEIARLLKADRDWTKNIADVLRTAGEALNLSRVELIRMEDKPGIGFRQTCLAGWCAPGLPSEAGRHIDLRVGAAGGDEELAAWIDRRRSGALLSGHTRDLSGELRRAYDQLGIRSFANMAVMVNGLWWGHISFDECRREREWDGSEAAVLSALTFLLGDRIELANSSLGVSEATRIAILQAAPQGIVVADEEGVIVDFNPAAEAIFGIRRGQAVGRQVASTLLPERLHPVLAAILKRLRGGGGGRFLGRHIETIGARAGGEFPLEFALTEISQGEHRLFVAYLRDLSGRKQAEADLARQREALHQSEKMTALGSLLAGVAHELNNPLSVVIGRAVMLEEDLDDAASRDKVKKLREAAERCAKISKTFLAMARQSPPARAPMQVSRAIASALDLVAYSLRKSGISVRQTQDERLPDVVADFDQLVQVFVNLFVNAEHAMRSCDGARILTVTTRMDGANLVTSVTDTGPGIGPDVISRIFEPFFTTKEVGSGTGLGLAVSFNLVAANGGAIEAVPQMERGACFRVSLPCAHVLQPARDDAPARMPGGQVRKVLVIDDETEVAQLLLDVFKRAGHDAALAETGDSALTLAASRDFDAIFCDLRMPGMDGRKFRQRLLRRFPAYERRFAFLTGDLLSLESNGGSLDGCPVIEKPFQAVSVLETLDQLVQSR